MPPEITKLTETFLHNPARVEVARASSTATTITQGLVASAPGGAKRETLRGLIRGADNFKNAIIFCNRKRDVAILHKSLMVHGFKAGALHGDMDQRARMVSLDDFKTGAVDLLVCSDVAARGLDIPDVSHVFNFDLPTHAEDYVHRIGRTGRAGRSGTAYSIVTRADQKYLDQIEAMIQRKLDWIGEATLDNVGEGEAEEPRGRGGRTRGGSAAPARGRGERDPSAAPRSRRNAPRREREETVEDVVVAAVEVDEGPTLAPPPRPRRDDQRRERTASPRENPRAAIRAPDDARRERRPRREEEEDKIAVGFTDHIPSFLLRSVKIKPANATPDSED